MAPIRVAIIGLSAGAITDWASRAHLPYLLSQKGKARFQIVALLNSSVAAAEKSIKVFNLPPETRAYGSPEDLAADPDVQLVLCSTRVDKHYETSLPSVKAGKDVFIEWPLAENAVKAAELVKAAKEGGGRTVVGLQASVSPAKFNSGWFIPTTLKLKELIASERIGKVLSSEFRAAGWTSDRSSISSGLKYFTDRKVGGNLITIGFGHVFDWVQHTLGDIQNVQSHLQLQQPNLKVQDSYYGRSIETVVSDVPDLIYVTGSLPGSEHIVKDATMHFRFRRSQAFSGEPALVWTIYGEKGEIRLTAALNTMLQVSPLMDVTIDIDDHKRDEVQRVEWKWSSYPELPYLSRSYGHLYEAYATGAIGKYADFEHALKRHTQLDGIWASWDASKAA
ncbi:hypothetical protein B0O99DRAFT_599593 [Bisporella sp. PMI_857]|nr:hypothetical protein B0O99DRAFT_599593 [Bisporella sp. PMI_857]